MERLLAVAVHFWAELDGWAVGHGGDRLEVLSLDRFCNFVWWWMTRNAEKEEDVDKLRERLWRPPRGERGEGVWSADAETAALDQAMKNLGV